MNELDKYEELNKIVLEKKVLKNDYHDDIVPYLFYEAIKEVIKDTEYELDDILFIHINKNFTKRINDYYDVILTLRNKITLEIKEELILMKMTYKVFGFQTISNNRNKETVNNLIGFMIEDSN